MISKKKLKENWIYLAVFLVFAVISLLVPLTSGDDLDWGSVGGMNRLANHFDNYNGRYFGNLVILVITRTLVIRVLFYSFINTLMVFSISRLSIFTSRITPVITTVLLLLIPFSVYAQTFGWFSGFANYNVAISLSLFVWLLVLEKSTPFSLLLIPIVTIMAQLCMENVTIFNVMISICYLLLRIKKKPIKELLFFLFSVIGALIMFSNSVYQSIANNQDGYRTFDLKMLTDVLFIQFSQQYFIDNWLIIILIAVLSFILYKESTRISTFIRLILVLFPISLLLFSSANIRMVNVPATVSIFVFLTGILFLLSVVFVITKLDIGIDAKANMICAGVCSGVIIAPMLIITPFGPRVMLTSYVFFLILINNLFGLVYKGIEKKAARAMIRTFIKTSLAVAFTLLVCIHSVNKYSIDYRSKHFVVNHENKTVTTYRVPFEQYAHYITPPASVPKANRTFKEEYNIPQDYELIFKPYSNSLLED